MDEEVAGAFALIWKMTEAQRAAFIEAIDLQLARTMSDLPATGETQQTA